jgi:hypothetical protein
MKLLELKEILGNLTEVNFELPNGQLVPSHFHVTEVGKIEKNFIDCGGTVRKESVVNFQLWNADDHDHRLSASKLISIIELSEKVIGIENGEIEVEYQSDTIGKYGLEFNGWNLVLTSKQTDCLAKDKCGIPEEKTKLDLAELNEEKESCCTPGGGCC